MTFSLPLPNSSAGRTTETVGLFRCDIETFVEWLLDGLGHSWSASRLTASPLGDPLTLVTSGRGPLSNRFVLAKDEWVFLLTDGPLGTDLGPIPSQAARDLGATAIRAVAVDPGSESLCACIFEVFDADAADPQFCRRHVYSVHDGHRWEFREFGKPLDFEDQAAYLERLIRNRLTPEMVRTYLQSMGAPTLTVKDVVSGYQITKKSLA